MLLFLDKNKDDKKQRRDHRQNNRPTVGRNDKNDKNLHDRERAKARERYIERRERKSNSRSRSPVKRGGDRASPERRKQHNRSGSPGTRRKRRSPSPEARRQKRRYINNVFLLHFPAWNIFSIQVFWIRTLWIPFPFLLCRLYNYYLNSSEFWIYSIIILWIQTYFQNNNVFFAS